MSGIDEIRPGNFVFYDLMQLVIGACREEEIAVVLACPVVAKHPEQQKLVIYGGAVHLSKESVLARKATPIFEHGVIHTDAGTIDPFNVGDLMAILPVHACLTANLMGKYLTLEGEVYECM